MSTETINEMKEDLVNLIKSPAKTRDYVLSIMSDLDDDVTVELDVTNPAIYMTEMAASIGSALSVEQELISRRNFPRLARSADDVYHHLTSDEIADNFAQPAEDLTIKLQIPISEIEKRSVSDSTTGYDMLVIPEHARWLVDGHALYSHFPIKIISLGNNNFQILYDLTEESPLKTVDYNSLTWNIARYSNILYLVIDIPVDQLLLTVSILPVSRATGFSSRVSFSDSFHYLRVWHYIDDAWKEMDVGYSTMVYDLTTPTAIATVTDEYVDVYIPEVYLRNGRVGGSVRLEVYTTEGEVAIDTREYSSSNWSVSMQNYHGRYEDYVAAMQRVGSMIIYTEENLEGGRVGLTVDQMRVASINGSKDDKSAVNRLEVKTLIEKNGMSHTVLKDNFFGVQHAASTRIDAMSNSMISGLNAALGDIIIDKSNENLTSAISSNDDRITILPGAIFLRENGTISIAEDGTADYIDSLGDEEKVAYLNSVEIFKQPFHIVIDESNNALLTRVYNLNGCTVTGRTYVNSNTALSFTIVTTDISLSLTDSGYTISVTAEIPDDIDGPQIQVSWYDNSTLRRYYLPFELIDHTDGIATFSCDLETAFDIDDSDLIEISNLMTSAGITVTSSMALTQKFDMVYLITSDSSFPSSFDDIVSSDLETTGNVACLYEKVSVEFGVYLESYFTTGRYILTRPSYKTYSASKEATYSRSKISTNSDGTLVYEDGGNGPEFVYDYKRGDTRLDSDGSIIYLYEKGDVVYENDEPVLTDESDIERTVKIPLYDGRYWYANTPEAVSYLESIPDLISALANSVNDLFSDRSQEQSEVFFIPTVSDSTASSTNADSETIGIDLSRSLVISFTLTSSAYQQEGIVTSIEKKALTVIRKWVDTQTFSLSVVYTSLMNAMPDQVTGVSIEGLFDEDVTLDNAINGFGIRSLLVVQPNGEIDIQDDITFKHKSI